MQVIQVFFNLIDNFSAVLLRRPWWHFCSMVWHNPFCSVVSRIRLNIVKALRLLPRW